MSDQLHHEIRLLTMLIHKISRQWMEQYLSEHGFELSMLQYGILHMVELQAVTLTELSGHMGLDPSTLVPVIKALEKRGYIERQRDPDDRRRYPLYLTESGQTLRASLRELQHKNPMTEAFNALGEDNLTQLKDLLERVVLQLPDGAQALAEMRAQMLEQRGKYIQDCDTSD